MQNKFLSRKFLVGMTAIALLVIKSLVPELNDLSTVELVAVAGTYIGFEGLGDVIRALGRAAE